MPLPTLIVALLLGLLLLNQHVQATSRLRWKLRLLTLEFGHWITLLSAVSVAFAWQNVLLLVIGAGFLRPTIQALRIARQRKLPFSMFRLFWPFGLGNGVSVERRPFWQNGPQSLDVVIYRPETASGGSKRRCVLAFHTGGWDSGDPGEFRTANRAIVSRCGVVICSFGYRLAPEHPWPAQMDDVRRAVAWTRENAADLGIDADDLILLGRSAGGQIATACAFVCEDLRVSGCIGVYGVPDMFFAREWSYPNDILNSLKLVRQYMRGDPDESPDNYHTASALRHIRDDSPRTLLIHGASDGLVWVEHSRRMTKLIADPARCDLLELPWGDHGCDYFPHSPGGQLALAEMERFLKA
ncbi:MAG: Carboxylesterase NlhH [Verrucomicrobiota bacterium]|jgi:acetyl esterase/lipase